MTAAARGSNESFDAFIENLMHEGDDTYTGRIHKLDDIEQR